MTKTWSEQQAIITGGASGIGLAIARKLRGLGVKVVLCDLDAKALASAQAVVGGNCRTMLVDVTDLEAVESAISDLVQKSGPVDILINSAGITGLTNVKSHEVDPSNVEHVFRVNFFGSFHTARAVLPGMLRQGYGRILHIASIAGKEGNAGMLAYSASKAAVIRTPMVDALPLAQVTYMTDKIPMKRCGTLDEIASMAAFIVSPEASFTTGFTFDLTGGRATY